MIAHSSLRLNPLCDLIHIKLLIRIFMPFSSTEILKENKIFHIPLLFETIIYIYMVLLKFYFWMYFYFIVTLYTLYGQKSPDAFDFAHFFKYLYKFFRNLRNMKSRFDLVFFSERLVMKTNMRSTTRWIKKNNICDHSVKWNAINRL